MVKYPHLFICLLMKRLNIIRQTFIVTGILLGKNGQHDKLLKIKLPDQYIFFIIISFKRNLAG